MQKVFSQKYLNSISGFCFVFVFLSVILVWCHSRVLCLFVRLHLQQQQQLKGRENQGYAALVFLPGEIKTLSSSYSSPWLHTFEFFLYSWFCSPHVTPPWRQRGLKCLRQFFFPSAAIVQRILMLRGCIHTFFVHLVCQLICNCNARCWNCF